MVGRAMYQVGKEINMDEQRIRVRKIDTGQTGSVLRAEFDPSRYESLEPDPISTSQPTGNAGVNQALQTGAQIGNFLLPRTTQAVRTVAGTGLTSALLPQVEKNQQEQQDAALRMVKLAQVEKDDARKQKLLRAAQGISASAGGGTEAIQRMQQDFNITPENVTPLQLIKQGMGAGYEVPSLLMGPDIIGKSKGLQAVFKGVGQGGLYGGLSGATDISAKTPEDTAKNTLLYAGTGAATGGLLEAGKQLASGLWHFITKKIPEWGSRKTYGITDEKTVKQFSDAKITGSINEAKQQISKISNEARKLESTVPGEVGLFGQVVGAETPFQDKAARDLIKKYSETIRNSSESQYRIAKSILEKADNNIPLNYQDVFSLNHIFNKRWTDQATLDTLKNISISAGNGTRSVLNANPVSKSILSDEQLSTVMSELAKKAKMSAVKNAGPTSFETYVTLQSILAGIGGGAALGLASGNPVGGGVLGGLGMAGVSGFQRLLKTPEAWGALSRLGNVQTSPILQSLSNVATKPATRVLEQRMGDLFREGE